MTLHTFVKHPRYKHCVECGYPEHEALKHERRALVRLDRAGMMFYDFVPHFYRGHCPPRDSHLWIEYVTPKGCLP